MSLSPQYYPYLGGVLLAGGLWGLLSSIPQCMYFGNLGMGIPYLDNALKGWNYCSYTAHEVNKQGQYAGPFMNAWLVFAMGTPPNVNLNALSDGACYGNPPTPDGQTAPDFEMFGAAWWAHLKAGFGEPFQSSFTLKYIGPFGKYALVPFLLPIAMGAAVLYYTY